MNIKNIEYFLQLARFEHVSVTADFLNISQPALSKSIAQLEEELGVRLFDRRGKRIKLNHNGENFMRYAEQALDILNNGIMSTRTLGNEITGKVSITCYSYASILSDCIADYHQLNPFTNFVLIEPDTEKQLDLSASCDFILYSSRDTSETKNEPLWVVQPLFNEKYMLVMAPGFREFPEGQTSVRLTDFRDDYFVTMAQDNFFFNDVTYSMCQDLNFFPRVSCQTDDFGVKMHAINSGMAIGLLPESCIADARGYCPGLRTFTLEDIDVERTIFVKRRHKSMMSESARDFWDFMLDFYHLPEDTRL